MARDRKEWIGVPVPVIIDEETFKRAGARVELNAQQADRSVKHQYLLGRRLKCVKCNYTYKGRTRKYNYYYYCGGREQRPVSVCDAPQFKGRDVDQVVWEWLVSLIKNPKALLNGLQGTKQESAQENQILIDRLEIIEKKIEDQDKQLAKFLDLYLAGEFPRELLTERKTCLEENLASLRKEHQELQNMIENVTLSESQMEEI